jgi:hypothetical protein
MQANRRRRWSALGLGLFGAVLVVFGRGTGSLDVGPPPALLAAWGFVTGATVGWIVASLPQRAVLPLGFGTLLAAAGFVAGTAFAVHVLGQDLIDGNPNQILASALVGAGVGWMIGIAIGAGLSVHATPFTSRQAWLLRGVGFAALPLGLALRWVLSISAGPWGLTERYLAWPLEALVADAVIVCLALLLVAGGRHPGSPPHDGHARVSSRFTRGVAWTGVALGCTVLIALVGSVIVTSRSVEHARQERANRRTAESLAAAARRSVDRRGTYPSDLASLLAAGGEVKLGSVVTALRADADVFLCLTVGTDAGSGEAVEPYWSATLRPGVTSFSQDHEGDDCGDAASPVPTGASPA